MDSETGPRETICYGHMGRLKWLRWSYEIQTQGSRDLTGKNECTEEV